MALEELGTRIGSGVQESLLPLLLAKVSASPRSFSSVQVCAVFHHWNGCSGRWRVIEDKDIGVLCACQGGDGGSCKVSCESAPMDMEGLHEAVEGTLDKGDYARLQVHSHEEGALGGETLKN